MRAKTGLAFSVAAVVLVGCSGSTAPSASSAPAEGGSAAAALGVVTNSCSSPAPPTAINQTITENIPSDFDPTANPSPTTSITFTVLLPQRCPGDRAPIVLQSHGYGGNRIKTLGPDGTLHPNDPHFPSIDELVQALPYHGYAVISYDERGHGDSTDANARIIDPRAEVQDARQILDWAYDHAAEYGFATQDSTGIAKDLDVGTIGYSYGGGFEMPLAALDPRIDTIVPNGTWYDLLYSLLPGDGVKLSYDGLLCLLASTASTSAQIPIGVHNTPLVQSLCNTVGVQGLTAMLMRTRQDLVTALASNLAAPRTVSETELNDFFFTHGMGYFQQQQEMGLAWGGSSDPFPGASPPLRPVPALFLQGNRDILFNMTEAYWNAQYFGAAGSDVRVITTEGGHMNPLANQLEGPANCGKVTGVDAVLAWFDHYLKGQDSATFDALPKVCISVAATPPNSQTATAYSDYGIKPVGVTLDQFPVGSLSGSGAIPVQQASLSATVTALTLQPVFVPVTTINVDGAVLAGIPRVGEVQVTPGDLRLTDVAAYVGVGIQRAGKTFLVDDQVTPFAQGDHTSNRGVPDAAVLLPGVGEQLQKGDVLGLLFYQHNVQYSAIVSAASVPGATNVINYVGGTAIPPITTALDLTNVALPNPYTVTMTDVELPVFIPGTYPGSALSQ